MKTLEAQVRTDFKKSTLKQLRNDGNVPGVVYGRDIDTESISIRNIDLLKVMRDVGRNGIFSLKLNGNPKNVVLRDYQRDPLTQKILHVDFLQVEKDTEIETKVHVILQGEAEVAKKAKAVANQHLFELDVTAKANDLPNEIVIDVADLEIGDSVQVANIKKEYNNCTFHHDDEETIVSIDYLKQESELEEDASELEASEV